MYNVVEKLRSREPLTPKEREVHEIAACGVLLDLHDELDRLVGEAYGWPWPMSARRSWSGWWPCTTSGWRRRSAATSAGCAPPRFGGEAAEAPPPELDLPAPAARPAAVEERRAWPAGAIEQIAAVKAVVAAAPATAAEAAAAFDGAPAALVRRHLETLAMVGEVRTGHEGRYEAVAEPL